MDKKKLDYYYDLLNCTILCKQNTITGLIPSHPTSSHAWVRDNVYASLSIWGLSLSYRKLPDVDEDRCRGYELEKDYGIWERGDKTNHGLPELNTSSVGMAKAALEAMSDLDLFGADGSPLSTIHVFPDETQQCNTVLESVLPRESNSKETDASLLSILTYPGFAVTDANLIKTTRETVIQKLLGTYGCRRFLRDGYRTAREDSNRIYYETWELRLFEGIECEWPLFFAWLVIDAIFREDLDDADRYMTLLQDIVIRESSNVCDGSNASERPLCRRISEVTNLSNPMPIALMPEAYAVQAECIDEELRNPHSQHRISVGALPHIWGQSLYILSSILYDNLLLPGEIDPLGRRLLTEPKPDLSVQVVLVAEDESMKCTLLDLQIEAQTYDEIFDEAGIHIYPAKVLGQLYQRLGVCEKLSLTGRANKEVGILSTSQFYRLDNQTVAFIPQFFDHHAFYLNLDVNFILDCFRTCVAFLKRAWTSPGRPILIFPIHHWFFRSAYSKTTPSALISTIRKMATGYINGTKVILGTLKTFEETSCLKQLDFVASIDTLRRSSCRSSPTQRRRRLTTTRFDAPPAGSSFLDDASPGGAHSISSASPSCSSVGLTYEQDNFQRFSMRRKSMALVHAITMDLTNQEQDDALQDVVWTENENQNPSNSGAHLLRKRTDSEDLTGTISKLALKRLLNPDSNSPTTHTDPAWYSLPPKSPTATTASRPRTPADTSGGAPTLRTPSGGHSRRTSEAGGHSGPDWMSSLNPEQLVGQLTHTDNLAEQVELLGRLHQLKGLSWDTGIDPSQPATVETLLKEVYERASQVSSWFLLRYTAGLLGKRASPLAKSLSDILVLQKQVTVGLPPEPEEFVIETPLPPEQLVELIQRACEEDGMMSVLTQEILIYLSMVARTKPQQLTNILRLRIGLIIQMMGGELARTMCLSAEDSLYVLFSMSPYDTKRLLLNLLSGEEIRMVKTARNIRRKSHAAAPKLSTESGPQLRQAPGIGSRRMSTHPRSVLGRVPSLSGTSINDEAGEVRGTEMRNLWSRRRKIDGALNRVPPKFYERVYIVLSRVQSLIIGGHVLCNSLTREMTMGEHKFALAVERVSTMVSTPDYRQLLIEATHVLGTLIMHDMQKSVHPNGVIKVEEIVHIANSLFLLDQVKCDANAMLCCAKPLKEHQVTDVQQASQFRQSGVLVCKGMHGVCQHFYDTPPAGRFGTMSYMVRAVAHLLQSFEAFKHDGLVSVDCSVQ